MEGNSEFAYKTLIFALIVALVLPTMIMVFIPSQEVDDAQDLLDDYYKFTGQTTSVTKEAVWVLRGVFEPFDGNSRNFTDDGWLYSTRVNSYVPTQYAGGPFEFSVSRDNSAEMYRYDDLGTGGSRDYSEVNGTGHQAGSLYTSVVFDKDHKSNIFFTKNSKYNQNGTKYVDGTGQPFYYEYTGWRYSFSPLANYYTIDSNGDRQEVIATTTSLSLIWYYFMTGDNGIAGQLVLVGSDQGLSFLSGEQIIKAFDSTTSTARFPMVFNGVDMIITIRIDPYALSTLGMTVQDAYYNGYWSVMVSSISTDINAYSGPDSKFSIWKIFETFFKLMTFNYSKLGMSDFMGTICSFIIIIPLYAGLLSMAMGNWLSMAMVGIAMAIQTIAAVGSRIGEWLGLDLGDIMSAIMMLCGLG